MLRLKKMDAISTQIYETVEEWYARETKEKRNAVFRKAFYFLYLTARSPIELFARPLPQLTLQRHQISNNLMGFVQLQLTASARHTGLIGASKFSIPVFLESRIDRESREAVFVEERMWEIVTDSWAYAPYTLDLTAIGANYAYKLYRKCAELRIRAYMGEGLQDVGMKPSDLRELRIYDLLNNHTDVLGNNPYYVKEIVGLRDMQWLLKSTMFRMTYPKNLIDSIKLQNTG